ncbi:MAG: hypothetical protein DMF94_10110 [Acidobacteria bacterium]|nr:MAG: hypothetical protein DMF94_10110 [Acidobacteriota bacterium]
MLIATSLAAALYASHAFAASGTAPGITAFTSVPPMIVDVVSAPDISASLVSSVLAETDAVWRGSGFTFVWRRATREVDPYASGNEAGPYPAATLRVVIGNETLPMRDGRLPLGWIRFDDAAPGQEIYLSYANVDRLMAVAQEVVGLLSQMPLKQREILSARAMGRALAHELGHYLLASKIHTEHGLMKASRSARELFAAESRGFQIDPLQRRVMAVRLRRESLVVSR